MSDVILISLPFAIDKCPSAGLSLLKAGLNKAGISSKIIYSNLLYKKTLSPDLFNRITNSNTLDLICEIIFASQAFPGCTIKHENLYVKYSEKKISTSFFEKYINFDELYELRKASEDFLKEVVFKIIEEKPKIVGFQSSFQQVCATVALCNYIKKFDNRIITVLGGYNAQTPMGDAIIEISPSLDYVFSGEADNEFVHFCKQVLKDKYPKRKVIQCKAPANLDVLPYPDYSDYFEQLPTDDEPMAAQWLIMETCRGCRYGEKSACSFCGGYGVNKHYRQKSIKRLKNELANLENDLDSMTIYPTSQSISSDFINKFFADEDVIGSIKDLYCEMVPNISYNELLVLKKNNLRLCRPGIETMNERLLGILNKGITVIDNVRFLRNCKSLGIYAAWILLNGIPGEDESDYYEMLELLPYLVHLYPPVKENAVAIQRYSSFFNTPGKFGISGMIPKEIYYDIFPDETNFENLAVYFDGIYKKAFESNELAGCFSAFIKNWQVGWSLFRVDLDLIKLNSDFYILRDTRYIVLEGIDANVSTYSVINRKYAQVLRKLREPQHRDKLQTFIEKNDLKSEFVELRNKRCVIAINDVFLSIVNERFRSYEQDYDDVVGPAGKFDYKRFIEMSNEDEYFFKTLKERPIDIMKQFGLSLVKKEPELLVRQLEEIFPSPV